MQITADVSKILKTVQRDLIFIFDVFLGSAIGFASFLASQAVENVVSLPFAIKKIGFCGALFKRILAWEGDISKTWFSD